MIHLKQPKFITFEGGEGSGKSTQSKMLYEYLLSKNIKAIHTREVGGTTEAEKIRDLLVHTELLTISELMLVMAARYEHINKIIIPALLDGTWVICDRFIDSTACYQSEDDGLSLEDIYDLHKKLMTVHDSSYMQKDIEHIAKQGVMPDLTFFMDVEPEIGLSRASVRGDANKFEEKDIEFHKKLYKKFKAISHMHKSRFISVNCENKSAEDIHKDVVEKVIG